jgi:hypothetical protein
VPCWSLFRSIYHTSVPSKTCGTRQVFVCFQARAESSMRFRAALGSWPAAVLTAASVDNGRSCYSILVHACDPPPLTIFLHLRCTSPHSPFSCSIISVAPLSSPDGSSLVVSCRVCSIYSSLLRTRSDDDGATTERRSCVRAHVRAFRSCRRRSWTRARRCL